ncbi:MAG: hypothetical protein ACLGSH_06410 [Acidobacteriota bacterium]
MTASEQRQFLVNAMVSLLRRTLIYQSLESWLTDQVGVPRADIEQVLNSIRGEMENETGLSDKLRTVVESALQSGEANYDLLLALSLSLWKPKGKPN